MEPMVQVCRGRQIVMMTKEFLLIGTDIVNYKMNIRKGIYQGFVKSNR